MILLYLPTPTLDGGQRMRMGEEDKTEAENLRVRDGYFLP